MTRCCPTCGRAVAPVDDTPDRLAALVEALRLRIAERGLRSSADDMVPEAVAGELLGKAPGTLRNWRAGARPLEFIRRGGQVLYPLAALAAWLDARQLPAD